MRPRSPGGCVLLVGGALAAAGCAVDKRQAELDTAGLQAEARVRPRDTAAASTPIGDGDLSMLIALINASEISAGSIASHKGIVADVRSFAAQMVAEHSAMQHLLGADTVAGPETTPAGRARADTLRRIASRQSDSLVGLPRGAAFDRAYIDQQVSGHAVALDSLRSWSAQTRSPRLDTLVAAALPRVQAHLDRARAVQASLGGVVHPAQRAGFDTTAASPAAGATRAGDDRSGS